ncbi:MAG: GntR family transcriptional regulator [Acidimicrobiales bacterium]
MTASTYPRPHPGARRRGGLADEVAAYVRDLILTGSLRPGTRIDQEAIAAALDVSRSPIREALVILGQEGLLDVTPRRGASVAHLAPEDIVDHYELYGVVAGRAAAMAAATLEDEQIAELEAIHARFSRHRDDGEDLSRLNFEFHRILNTVAPRRTRWLLRLLERSVPTDYYEFADGWNRRAIDQHAAILEAVIARDPDRARQAMEEHLRQSGLAAAEALRASGFWDDALGSSGALVSASTSVPPTQNRSNP